MSQDMGASTSSTGPAPSGLSPCGSQAEPLVPSALANELLELVAAWRNAPEGRRLRAYGNLEDALIDNIDTVIDAVRIAYANTTNERDEALLAHLTVYSEADDYLPPNICLLLDGAADRIREMLTALGQAEAALAIAVEGNPMGVGKNDRCRHGMYGFEGCFNCTDEVLEPALAAVRTAQAIEAGTGETACGLDPKGESAVAESDAP